MKVIIRKHIDEISNSVPLWTSLDFWDKKIARSDKYGDLPVQFLIDEWYLEKVKEEEINKPRWKVGDYVVYSYKKYPPSYIKIHTIVNTEGWWCYNDIGGDDLRDPTQEELKTYFR